MTTCNRCHRPLTDAESVRLGLGPVCRAKARRDHMTSAHDGRTVAELPWDPETMDVVCARVPTGELDPAGAPLTRPACNLNQAVVQHSPTGFEWGYGGSGPADFALNILHLFLPPHVHTAACYDREEGERPALACEQENVRCHDGEVSQQAWVLHQSFKRHFLVGMPRAGGVILGQEIRVWIRQALHARALGMDVD